MVTCQAPSGCALLALAHRFRQHGGFSAAADMARFEHNAIRDYRRLSRLGVTWLEPYRAPGVIRWHDDVSLVFVTSNHDGDVGDLLTAALNHFRKVGVVVLGHALTDCRSVGCCFVWRSKGETERITEKWAEG